MAIVLIVVGVLLVAVSDWLQPDPIRKPKLNLYLGFLGGIIWLSGVIVGFLSYSLLNAILLLIGSFALGAILKIRK